MKKLATLVITALTLSLSACVNDGPQPIQTVTPAPSPSDTASPTPTTTPTPTQEELSAAAEQTYRAFFDEWKRLEFEGGTDEPTPILRDNGADKYLDGVMLFLKDQKNRGYTVGGEVPVTTVVARPGEADQGSDPRLTLAVCEDSTHSWHTDAEGRHQGQLSQGTVYLRVLDGRMKVIWANTKVVESCALL